MLNLREIEEAIKELESGSSTYNNCMKLASLYIVRDELMKKQGQYSNYYNYTRPYYPMMYERGGRSGNDGQSSNSSYAYTPMMYHNDDDLIIRKDMYDRRG